MSLFKWQQKSLGGLITEKKKEISRANSAIQCLGLETMRRQRKKPENDQPWLISMIGGCETMLDMLSH